MNYGLLLRTVRYLRPKQVFYQMKNRLIKPAFRIYDVSKYSFQNSKLTTAPIPKYKCVDGNMFSFLNLNHEFAGWNFTDNGMLWAYNQNYFDWINQEDISIEECCGWIDKYIVELSDNKVGLDPYPIALRCINWTKFFCKNPECATKPRLDSLYSQLRLLEKKLEYHLLGNHLLEDAYALYFCSSYINDCILLKKGEKLLVGQLKEQILPDGAHYEQSPMYHCILLDRLLDCINIRRTEALVKYAQMMLGHLESIVWKDGSIPLFNDAAIGIAPTSNQIFEYARRLGLAWTPIAMNECGYRKLYDGRTEVIIDCGNITATYQPGHSHADTLNYVVRIDGIPVIVETGISTYDPTQRRRYERSTPAHNCVCVDGVDSSEVWGGFRVGKRCNAKIIQSSEKHVIASHDGYKSICIREYTLNDGRLIIQDRYKGNAVSYIHLAPGVSFRMVSVENAIKVEILNDEISDAYNVFKDATCMKIYFKDSCKYTIG